MADDVAVGLECLVAGRLCCAGHCRPDNRLHLPARLLQDAISVLLSLGTHDLPDDLRRRASFKHARPHGIADRGSTVSLNAGHPLAEQPPLEGPCQRNGAYLTELCHGNRESRLHKLRNSRCKRSGLKGNLVTGHAVDDACERLLQAKERRLIDPQHGRQSGIDRCNGRAGIQAVDGSNERCPQLRVRTVQDPDDRHDLAVAQPGQVNLMADQLI
ncbi:hypothetical protein D9M71_535230 [compost metagenome]